MTLKLLVSSELAATAFDNLGKVDSAALMMVAYREMAAEPRSAD